MTIGGIRPDQFAAGSPHSLAVLRAAGLEPRCCCINTGADHEPTRAGLEHATGLPTVEHPQFWSAASLVARAVLEHESRALHGGTYPREAVGRYYAALPRVMPFCG